MIYSLRGVSSVARNSMQWVIPEISALPESLGLPRTLSDETKIVSMSKEDMHTPYVALYSDLANPSLATCKSSLEISL